MQLQLPPTRSLWRRIVVVVLGLLVFDAFLIYGLLLLQGLPLTLLRHAQFVYWLVFTMIPSVIGIIHQRHYNRGDLRENKWVVLCIGLFIILALGNLLVDVPQGHLPDMIPVVLLTTTLYGAARAWEYFRPTA
jgi:uncharacterized membrane protein YfcA